MTPRKSDEGLAEFARSTCLAAWQPIDTSTLCRERELEKDQIRLDCQILLANLHDWVSTHYLASDWQRLSLAKATELIYRKSGRVCWHGDRIEVILNPYRYREQQRTMATSCRRINETNPSWRDGRQTIQYRLSFALFVIGVGMWLTIDGQPKPTVLDRPSEPAPASRSRVKAALLMRETRVSQTSRAMAYQVMAALRAAPTSQAPVINHTSADSWLSSFFRREHPHQAGKIQAAKGQG